ncbi:uncharacterized protein FYW47_013919 [Aplochiton taeniatus]
MVTGPVAACAFPGVDLRTLWDRVKVLEQSQSDSHLRSRVQELEVSERKLLLQISQLTASIPLPQGPSMLHQRLDQRLHVLREEVHAMSQEKERGERAWRDRLQRCQNQLRAKEDEMTRQSQYFQNFKAQLQQKLTLARDREQNLQSRVHVLEKQLLDMTVSAATNMASATVSGIAAGLRTELVRLPCPRGEGEGEEGEDEEDEAGDEEKEESVGETRLRGFIFGLQEDLRALLEREAQGVAEQRRLAEQLQEAQEKSHFLSCKVEEVEVEARRARQSEGSLLEEVEQLREENQNLHRSVGEASSRKSPSRSLVTGLMEVNSGPGSPSSSAGFPSQSMGQPEPCHNVAEVSLAVEQQTGQPPLRASLRSDHQRAAESTVNHHTTEQTTTAHHNKPIQPLPIADMLNPRHCCHPGPDPSPGPLPLATERVEVGAFRLGEWCSGGSLRLDERPSEESDALREAYRSLGLGEDLETLQEQRDQLEAALTHTQAQLERLAQENACLKSQLREKEEVEGGHEEIQGMSGDLTQPLNQENRALADRVQELLQRIRLQEGERHGERARQKQHMAGLEREVARLEQENREQGGLVAELTGKTEDDLNTIMELQSRLAEGAPGIDDPAHRRASESGLEKVDRAVQTTPCEMEGLPAPGSWDHAQKRLEENGKSRTVAAGLVGPQAPPDPLSSSSDDLGEELELARSVAALKEDQREVTLCVQRKTEEKQKLTRAVWVLKEERDRLGQSLASLKPERDQLARAVGHFKAEKEQFAQSMGGLREEKEQLSVSVLSLREEKEKLLASLSGEREEVDRTGVLGGEQGKLMREVEAIGADLKKTRMELEKKQAEAKRLHSDLAQSEARREEAERRAKKTADEVLRMAEVTVEMEEARKENDRLVAEVKVLNAALSGLRRTKADLLSLKSQLEEQLKGQQAQLTAKTVALEELNSEYRALRGEERSREDWAAMLTAVRARYDDIRAKYDVLLRKRSQTDLDVAPLKAKLSCLVLKCQARNSLLVRMMRALRGSDCLDPSLGLEAEHLLRDPALQDYTQAFRSIDPWIGINASGVHRGNARAESTRGRDGQLVHDAANRAAASAQAQVADVPGKCGQYHAVWRGVSSEENRAALKQVPPLPDPCCRRLSSPEKIINLHQQLQNTLSNQKQAPVGRVEAVEAEFQARGRGSRQPSPRKGPFSPATGAPRLASPTINQDAPHLAPVPNTPTLPQAQRTWTASPPTALFAVVSSRSATLDTPPTAPRAAPRTSVPHGHPGRAHSSLASPVGPPAPAPPPLAPATATIEAFLSGSSFSHSTVGHSRLPTAQARTVTTPPGTASRVTPGHGTAPRPHGNHGSPSAPPDRSPVKPRAPARAGPVVCGPSTVAPRPGSSTRAGAGPSEDQAATWSPSKPTPHTGETLPPRAKPEAPAGVGSVEVIRKVGQSSLLIGWLRPPLDELGCSSGTFVYGYRVYVDGEFHKSVLSSACTKCIVENVDLILPIHISVQTLGSNGLNSTKVHTVFRPPAGTVPCPGAYHEDQHGSVLTEPPPPCPTSSPCGRGSTQQRNHPNLHPSLELPAYERDTVMLPGNLHHDDFCEAKVGLRMSGCAQRCKRGLVKFAMSLHKLVTGTLIKGSCRGQ